MPTTTAPIPAGNWTVWAVLLLAAFPVLVIATGEALDRLRARNPDSPYLTPLAILRHGVLPLAFVDGLLRIVVGLGEDHLAVKLADTALSIVVLNAAIAFLNGLLFGEDAQLAGRVRLPRLLLDLTRLVLVLCGAAIVVARTWGVDVSSVFTALGVGSVVLGLALQDTLGSIFAGIALVSARQIHVGDWIKYGTDEGEVLAMNWRAVKIRTSAGDVLYVPNGVISKQAVRVLTLGKETTTLPATVRFPYGTSPDAVVTLMTEVARTTRGFHLVPPPVALVNALDDGGIEYSIGVRATDPRQLAGVRSEYLTDLWFAAQRAGLTFTGALGAAEHAPPPARQPAAAVAETLARVGAFRLDPDGLERLARDARVEQYRAGQTIVAQGAVTGDVYVLVSGRASAVFAAGGHEIVLHGFEPGQAVMAKSLFQGRGTPFAFRAATELEVVAIPLADFREICLADFALAREIEQILTAREEAAARVLAKASPETRGDVGLSDRMQLMREMFQS
ncbi:mechanosensitive ion channel [Methylobacterium sp. NEAU 140]|uniref:mechanosensitive ion channel domain-containing protein n=1 Tax=Methylobacterium sp. NEAU 140 TaxID=3064945 RepID=UPI0027370EB9|nr:mechanosensitive ion channel domain-containing protein [Methylobacterium sp. NEAU 140]MDP4021889.1 mechanosensitive ion channel [Methylobacterium sp. NEAU 140]